MITASELREKYFAFFKEKEHSIIPSASLVPENDPTVLFTTAGMHPLVPYLLGEKHPGGKRVVSAQKCVRTDDIDEVGDAVHHTFFEMLGNWSFGDYFKADAITWSWEFLTDAKWLGIDKNRLAISIFAGDDDAPLDEESKKIWLGLGVPEERIAALPKKNNWWGPAGQTGPCGPDTEMFYWASDETPPAAFDADDSRWVEIWNDVFMQYNKKADATFEPLAQKNVDTGMGLERTLAVLNGLDDNYRTELFWPIIEKIQELSGKKYSEHAKEMRIIADHVRAGVMIASDGVAPSNVEQGYILRRLLTEAIRHGRQLGIQDDFLVVISKIIQDIYYSIYPAVEKRSKDIQGVLESEEERLKKNIQNSSSVVVEELKKRRIIKKPDGSIFIDTRGLGLAMFNVHSTSAVYPESFFNELDKKGIKLNDFQKSEVQKFYSDKFKEHQELSRTASAGKFKGGLADHGEMAVKYHTATHLLHAALHHVLGEHATQKGSNITAERLRFDFVHPQKMTQEEIKQVEDWVNDVIKKDLPVSVSEMSVKEAKDQGAMGLFEGKYADKVKVYSIGDVSKEICGGPHMERTGTLGKFKITKEESASAGVRRIRAALE